MLLSQLATVEKIAAGSKLARLVAHPGRYVTAIAFRQLLYPFLKKGWPVPAQTFWKEPFLVELPAGTDIYLTGGKADDSEIRLARYLIQTLKPGDDFLDIGGHFGYFSRLALRILQGQGTVIAVEPAQKTFALLQKNLQGYAAATAVNCLVGAENTDKVFFEFPPNYSEYNTAFPEQFAEQDWYKKATISRYAVVCKTVDSIVAEFNIKPKVIKIDTEGSELEVIQGAAQLLSTNKDVTFVLEYLCQARHNEAHVKATEILKKYHFYPFVITPAGTLASCHNVEQYLQETNRESDNLVYQYGR